MSVVVIARSLFLDSGICVRVRDIVGGECDTEGKHKRVLLSYHFRPCVSHFGHASARSTSEFSTGTKMPLKKKPRSCAYSTSQVTTSNVNILRGKEITSYNILERFLSGRRNPRKNSSLLFLFSPLFSSPFLLSSSPFFSIVRPFASIEYHHAHIHLSRSIYFSSRSPLLYSGSQEDTSRLQHAHIHTPSSTCSAYKPSSLGQPNPWRCSGSRTHQRGSTVHTHSTGSFVRSSSHSSSAWTELSPSTGSFRSRTEPSCTRSSQKKPCRSGP